MPTIEKLETEFDDALTKAEEAEFDAQTEAEKAELDALIEAEDAEFFNMLVEELVNFYQRTLREQKPWLVEANLEALREYRLLHALDKDPMYALFAIAACASAGLPIPSWAAKCFMSCFEAFHRAGSLDRAFNVDRVWKQIVSSSENENALPERIFSRVNERRRKGESIGEGLFEDVARELGVSSWSQCRKLYYLQKRLVDDLKKQDEILNIAISQTGRGTV